MRKLIVMAALAAAVLSPALALSQVEEVVVTGERREEAIPHIFVVKRADHLITTVRVTCDTRDARQRKEEVKETLRAMVRAAAASKTISLGTEGDSILGAIDEAGLDEMIESDTRPDTSKVTLVIKTTVSKDDTLESATGRIKEFIDSTPKVGRTEVLRDNHDWDLTIIGPEQYRDRLITDVVADARHTADLFGAGYGITIEGLERPVTWSQKGPLDLALYIPYTLHIAPAH